ncbi:MAG: sugar ABC transporter substrate-binding protein [Rhodospirillales bacterium]
MTKKLDPRAFPDFTDRRVVDRHMDRLNLQGLSRRDFLAFASASAVASTAALSMGFPGVALADGSGKVAHLMMTARLEYAINADDGAKQASQAFGLDMSTVDGQLDSQRQLDQFEQQMAAGVQGVMLHAPGGGSIRRIAQLANENKIWLDNTWGTLPWFTPFEAGDYYTMYAVPEEYSAHKGVTETVCQAVMDKFGGGILVGVTGVEGNSTDLIRSRGRDAAIAEFPQISLAGELPGKWNREDSQKAMEDLISRHPDIRGVIAQNDDVADGCISALRAAGYRPGDDVFIGGADGTSVGAEMIQDGRLLCTSANVPQYMGALLISRLYDVMNGWKPSAPERMMNWRSVTMTKDNVSTYLERYVNNDGVAPFDFELMSKVKHPSDWDPQAELFPMDIDLEWGGIPQPDGWKYPEAYLKAREGGESEKVRMEYAQHYKIDLFGPSPMKQG